MVSSTDGLLVVRHNSKIYAERADIQSCLLLPKKQVLEVAVTGVV